MERLTNHFDYCKFIDCKYYDAELFKQGKCKFFDESIEHCHEKRMNDKLREYEDAEEQGMLLKLPCKVGDAVFCFWSTYNFKKGNPVYEIIEECFEMAMIEDFGKTVFLTREEAEAALERMGD